MELLNCQMPLSMTAVIGLVIILIVVIHDNGNYTLIIPHTSPPQESLIIIVFNIETYLKYLLFNKLRELMDYNIFVILS